MEGIMFFEKFVKSVGVTTCACSILQRASLERVASRILKAGYQMNTHAIGDSANIAVIRAYKKALAGTKEAGSVIIAP